MIKLSKGGVVMDQFMGSGSILLFIFLFVLAMLWFLLPFAVFGVKNRLDMLIKEQNKTNDYLMEIIISLNSEDHQK